MKSPVRRPVKRSPQRRRRSPMRKRSSRRASVGVGMDTSTFRRNSLGQHGYKSSLKLTERRMALDNAVKAYGPHAVWSKLNAVSILNKNRSPSTSKVFTADKNWIKRTYEM